MKIFDTKYWSWSVISWVYGHLSSLKFSQRWRFTYYFMKNISPTDYEFIHNVYKSYLNRREPPTSYQAFWRTYFYFSGLQCQKACMTRRGNLFSPGEIYEDTKHLKSGEPIIHYPFITLERYEGSIFEA